MNNVFVRCDSCLRVEGECFQDLVLNIMNENLVLTAIHSAKTYGPRLTADWNSSERCPACCHGWSDTVTRVVMSLYMFVCGFIRRIIVKLCLFIL